MPTPKLLVCLTGMPGAGKSTVAAALSGAEGISAVSMGDVIRTEAARQGVGPSAETLGRLMFELCRERGAGAVAELLEGSILECKTEVLLVDGIRSAAEVETLKRYCPVRLLSIHASAGSRYGFLSARGRSDDPASRDGFDRRDKRELAVGISTPIALADETISNNGITKEDLIGRAHGVIRKWIETMR